MCRCFPARYSRLTTTFIRLLLSNTLILKSLFSFAIFYHSALHCRHLQPKGILIRCSFIQEKHDNYTFFSYLMCFLYNFNEIIPPPHVDIATKSSRICDVIRTKGETQHGLNLTNFSENSPLISQCIATQCPEFNVLNSTADNGIFFKWMKLDIEYLIAEIQILNPHVSKILFGNNEKTANTAQRCYVSSLFI